MARWHVNPKQPRDRARESTLEAFFSGESIESPGEAIVREGIQNSLDAARVRPDGRREKVHIRLFISGQSQALQRDTLSGWFDSAWDHLRAAGNGLSNAPNRDEACAFLVVEDFGTCGLEGDPEQWHEVEDRENPFYYFFRVEGRSRKGHTALGRWGIGKAVFLAASRARSLLALTVRRNDSRHLLMGQWVLKSHRVASEWYLPDGWFGENGTDGLVLPIEDPEVLRRFRKDFHLSREDEPGLSIVVPWPILTSQGNGEETVEGQERALLEAVVSGYFLPILSDQLTVTIATPDRESVLDAQQLIPKISEIAPNSELLRLVEFARWGVERTEGDFSHLQAPDPLRAQKWSDDLMPDALAGELRQRLERGERIAVRVPLTLRPKGDEPRGSYFDVFFVRDGAESGRPKYIREGLIISGVHGRRDRGVRSLVIINDDALAEFLGDSENPAHTEWQKKGPNFKDKYTFGPSALDYVIDSVHEIIRIISRSSQEEDRTLLIDFFSLPAEPEEAEPFPDDEAEQSSKSGAEPESPSIPKLPRPPRRFRLEQTVDGFRVARGDEGAEPRYLEIHAAYDVRRGNPFKKYAPADFQFGHRPLEFEPAPNNVAVLAQNENRLMVEVTGPDFSLHVRGFDPNRQLVVRVLPKDQINVDS